MTRNPTIAALIALLATDAQAGDRTLYDARTGRVISRSTTDTQGTRTLYGSDGKAISRESKGTVYDAESGRALGTITKPKGAK